MVNDQPCFPRDSRIFEFFFQLSARRDHIEHRRTRDAIRKENEIRDERKIAEEAGPTGWITWLFARVAAARSLARTTPLHLLGDPSRTAFTTAPHPTLWGQDAQRRQLDTTRGVAPPHVQLPAPLQPTPLADPLYPFFRFRQLFSRSFTRHPIVPLHAAPPLPRDQPRTLPPQG